MNKYKELLSYINPSALSYSDWCQVGMALKAEGQPCELWEEWSSSDPRHKTGECYPKWETFQSDGVTAGTIYHLAYEGGMPRPEQENRVLSWDDFIGSTESKAKIKDEMPDTWHPEQELIAYLSNLFDDTDIVGYVTDSYTTGDRRVPGKGSYTRTAGELINGLLHCNGDVGSVIGDYDEGTGAWIRFNPLDGKGIKNENVTRYRYGLVESDAIPIDEQIKLIRRLNLPVACMVHSGKKSIHAIVRIDANSYNEYKDRIKRLFSECVKVGLVPDEQNKNPSRLSRMPGVMRNGNKQYLMATNIGASSWEDWIRWLETESDTLPEFVDLAEVWGEPITLAPELIKGVLRQGHKMIITGPSKAGKSFFLTELAVAIASGSEWINLFKCKRGKVLYCNLEIDPPSFRKRLVAVIEAMGGCSEQDLHNLHIWNLRGQILMMEAFTKSLIRRIKDEGYTAVIIDPIYKLNTGDENSAGDMAKFLGQMDAICHLTGASVIYSHHHAKGDVSQKSVMDRGSGSGVLARDPDAIIDLTELDVNKPDEDKHRGELVIFALQQWLRRTQGNEYVEENEFRTAEEIVKYCYSLVDDTTELDNILQTIQDQDIKAFRMAFVLREFVSRKPMDLWFDYPIHHAAELSATRIAGSQQARNAKANEEEKKIRTDEERILFRNVYDSKNLGNGVWLEDMAECMGISSRTLRRKAEQYGYRIEKGKVYADHTDDGTAEDNGTTERLQYEDE